MKHFSAQGVHQSEGKIEPFPHLCTHPPHPPLLTLLVSFFFPLSHPPQGGSKRVIAQWEVPLVPHASRTKMNTQLALFQTIK